MATNLSLNEFIPKTLQEAVLIDRSPTKFLTNMFFRDSEVHRTDSIKLDVYKENRRAAVYTDRVGDGTDVRKTGYTSNAYTPPYIQETISITPSDLRQRAPGIQEILTNADESTVMAANAAWWIEQNRMKLSDRIDRAEELQVSQLALNGTVTPQNINGTTLTTIDFSRDTALDSGNNTAGVLWDQTGANPVEDIFGWVRKLRRISGINDRRAVVVLGYEAAKDFRANANVQSYLDNRRYPSEFMLEMEHLAMDQAFFLGMLGGSILVFEYDGTYDAPGNPGTADPTDSYFITAEDAIIGFENAGRDVYRRHYAAIEHIDTALTNLPIEAERFFNEWVQPNGSALVIEAHSAPLMATHNPDAFLSAVCTTAP